jgi:autoinducer 2-degrading protein
VSPALCDWTCGRSKGNLTWVYVYEVYKDAGAFEDHTKNEPVKKFNEIMSSVIEGWTMVIPFGDSVTSNLDE